MLKLYAEIIEITEKEPKNFQVMVKNKAEAITKINEKMADFVGLKVEKRLHFCRHIETGEETNQACSVEKL